MVSTFGTLLFLVVGRCFLVGRLNAVFAEDGHRSRSEFREEMSDSRHSLLRGRDRVASPAVAVAQIFQPETHFPTSISEKRKSSSTSTIDRLSSILGESFLRNRKSTFEQTTASREKNTTLPRV